jgi:hypothetical protein
LDQPARTRSLLRSQADVRNGRIIILHWNNGLTVASGPLHLTPLLGEVVLVCKPTLRLRLDHQGIGLRLLAGGILSDVSRVLPNCAKSNSMVTIMA